MVRTLCVYDVGIIKWDLFSQSEGDDQSEGLLRLPYWDLLFPPHLSDGRLPEFMSVVTSTMRFFTFTFAVSERVHADSSCNLSAHASSPDAPG